MKQCRLLEATAEPCGHTADIQPARWVVAYGERMHREAYFGDRALAVAYAAAHAGVVVPMANLAPWPQPTEKRSTAL